MNDIQITVRLFGSFRQFGEHVSLTVPAGSDVKVIKEKLAETLSHADPALIHDSAMANDNEIIAADVIFEHDAHLAILPPVCGG